MSAAPTSSRAASGAEERRSVSVRQQLADERSAMKVAFGVARRYTYKSQRFMFDRDEADSAVLLGAALALATHEPWQGASISTFIGVCVQGQLYQVAKRKCFEECPLDGRFSDIPAPASELEAIHSEDARRWLRETLDELVTELPRDHQAIIRRFYYLGQSLPEIAEVLSIHKSVVWSKKQDALTYLRGRCAESIRLPDLVELAGSDGVEMAFIATSLLKACEVCEKRFLPTTTTNTCSDECKRTLRLANRRKNHHDRKARSVNTTH
jgi:DNA-directed RNA polymerase specialized sigma24 family protein